MRKFRLLILLLICCAGTVSAQNASTANQLFEAGEYAAAQAAYRHLLAGNPRSPLYAYRYARCAQESGDYTTAIAYFDRAGERYPLKYFYLGEIYMQTWEGEKAVSAYENYLRLSASPNDREPYIREQIRKAEKRQRYLRRVEKVEILDSVEVSIDSMVLVCAVSAEAGTLTADGAGGMMYTNQRGDRRLWSAPCDTGRKIVSSHRLLDQWTVPDTLPESVNRGTVQMSPYVLSDGITLYFASNDSDGLGGLDLYVSRYNTATETYTHPENLGYPFNSEANEYLMVIDETRHTGYFATDRFSPAGRVRVYSFVHKEQKEYWRGIRQDSLVAYAQLRRVLHADSIQAERAEVPQMMPQDADKEENEVLFVVNDTTVYTSEDDFRSAEARALFDEWQALQAQAAAEKERLEQLRREYSEADAAQRKQMSEEMLRMEQALREEAARAKTLLNTARQNELKAIGSNH